MLKKIAIIISVILNISFASIIGFYGINKYLEYSKISDLLFYKQVKITETSTKYIGTHEVDMYTKYQDINGDTEEEFDRQRIVCDSEKCIVQIWDYNDEQWITVLIKKQPSEEESQEQRDKLKI